MKFERVNHCRICGNPQLKKVLDLGEQALSGRFPKVGTPDPPVAPLELVQCTGRGCCGLVQLAHSIPLQMLYGSGYGYLSGLNPVMKKHLEEIAIRAEHLVKLGKGDVVIDIGCNDGTLLKAYESEDINRVGFDSPAYFKYFDGTHILFIPEFFREYAVKAKIITSIAMFYDLPEPNLFVQAIKNTLAPDGIWILEQSYLPSMLSQNAFDTICHEHIEYYGIKQIQWLLEKHDLGIFECEFNISNGGSFRLYVCHKNLKTKYFEEKYLDIDEKYDFPLFMMNIELIKQRLTTFLKAEKALDKSIHLYGASTKGNVLLQYMGIDYRLVSLAVDVNPGKNGCWTPGTHIPIYTKEFLVPDYYLVLPWHFREGFIKQEHSYLKAGGKLVFPLPEPEIVSMENDKIVVRQI